MAPASRGLAIFILPVPLPSRSPGFDALRAKPATSRSLISGAVLSDESVKRLLACQASVGEPAAIAVRLPLGVVADVVDEAPEPRARQLVLSQPPSAVADLRAPHVGAGVAEPHYPVFPNLLAGLLHSVEGGLIRLGCVKDFLGLRRRVEIVLVIPPRGFYEQVWCRSLFQNQPWRSMTFP